MSRPEFSYFQRMAIKRGYLALSRIINKIGTLTHFFVSTHVLLGCISHRILRRALRSMHGAKSHSRQTVRTEIFHFAHFGKVFPPP